MMAMSAVGMPALAQTSQKRWTLKECIEHAIAHNIEVKQSSNQVRTLNVQRSTLRNSFLPGAESSMAQKFIFGRSLNQSNTYENRNIQNSTLSVAAEVGLFSGFKRTASLEQNKFDLLAAEANHELIKNNLSLSVVTAYFQILLDKEILKIAEEQIRLTQDQEACTQLLVDNGKVATSQLYEVKAQLADDESAATEARNSLRLARLDLCQLLEMEMQDSFDVDSVNENVHPMDSRLPADIYGTATGCMPQIKQAYYNLQSKTKGIRIARAGYYPSLSFGVGLNTEYYNYGKGLSDSFSKQFSNNMQRSIYFTLSVPIFDRFSTRNQIREAKIAEDNARLALDNENKKLYKEIEKAYADARSAYDKYQSAMKAVATNEEAHRYALEKYAAGKSTAIEYNEVKMKLANALSQQSQAKFTYLLRCKVLNFYACQPLAE